MFERVLALWTSVWKPGPIRAGAGAPLEDDRRDLPRHSRTLEVTCRLMGGVGDAPRWPAVVQDISAGGIGLLSPQTADLESRLTLQWPRSIPGIPTILAIRVVRVTAQPGGLWRFGCVFDTELSKSQLQTLLDALHS